MKSKFFDAMRALLPRSRAFDITQSTNLRLFFESLAPLPEDVRTELENVYADLFPDSTRALSKWEEMFRIQFSSSLFDEDERRNILQVMWWMRFGNTTAAFLQKCLQKLLGDGVYVTENNPLTNVLSIAAGYLAYCGADDTYCGGEYAMCGYSNDSSTSQPTLLRNDTEEIYDLPDDETYWANCFFVSGPVTRAADNKLSGIEWLEVDAKWQKLIEFCVLALKPVHMTAVMYVDYVE